MVGVTALARWLRLRLLRIDGAAVECSHRGFVVDSAAVRARLEAAGHAFLEGYHAALASAGVGGIPLALAPVPPIMRGFAFEGAAMALALCDLLTVARWRRLRAFLTGPASAHTYMVHVGVGWALARCRRQVTMALPNFDKLLGWLIVDGYGFHEGYFHWPHYLCEQYLPRHLRDYEVRAFDQGLGRSLWFVAGAGVDRVRATIASFPEERRGDLWSGVGLACAYAGGADQRCLETLRRASGGYAPMLGQGAAFAAKARDQAGNPAPHTAKACLVLCGMRAEEAAALTDRALALVPAQDCDEPRYECWRREIRRQLAIEAAA